MKMNFFLKNNFHQKQKKKNFKQIVKLKKISLSLCNQKLMINNLNLNKTNVLTKIYK